MTESKYVTCFSFKHALLTVLLIIVGISGCKDPESSTKPDNGEDSLISNLQFSVTLPDPVQADGVDGVMAYYWPKEGLSLSGIITQGSKSVRFNSLNPTSEDGSGHSAFFSIALDKETSFNENEPIKIDASLSRSGEQASTEAFYLFASELGGRLPFDLLGSVPQSFIVKGEISQTKSTDKKTVYATPVGRYIVLQIQNNTKEPIKAKDITLTSDKAVFPNGEVKWDTENKLYLGSPLGEKVVLHPFQENNTLGEITSYEYLNALIWLPGSPEDLGTISAAFTYESGNKQKETSANTGIAVSKLSLPLSFNLTIEGLQLANEFTPLEADDSTGGDPRFTMSDIDYWVGEGSKRAALVLEWHITEGKDAFVWGYRFDGDKTGWDMFQSVVKADPRLAALVSYSTTLKAWTIGGIVFRENETELSPRPPFLQNTKEVETDENGFTITDTTKEWSQFSYADPKALVRIGFENDTPGYWSYFIKSTRIQPWIYSGVSPSLRLLQDGSWDGLSFQTGWDKFRGEPLGSTFHPAKPLAVK